jgi:hypothetical protein
MIHTWSNYTFTTCANNTCYTSQYNNDKAFAKEGFFSICAFDT